MRTFHTTNLKIIILFSHKLVIKTKLTTKRTTLSYPWIVHMKPEQNCAPTMQLLSPVFLKQVEVTLWWKKQFFVALQHWCWDEAYQRDFRWDCRPTMKTITQNLKFTLQVKAIVSQKPWWFFCSLNIAILHTLAVHDKHILSLFLPGQIILIMQWVYSVFTPGEKASFCLELNRHKVTWDNLAVTDSLQYLL